MTVQCSLTKFGFCIPEFAFRIPTLFKNIHSFSAKKMKDTLSSFLPQLPGVIDTQGSQDNSALRGLIEKPPGK